MKHHRGIVLSLPRLLLCAAVVAGVATVGLGRNGHSSASSTGNPYGILDSCVLSGSTTVLYGWAVDPQLTTPTSTPNVTVKAGSHAVTVGTNSTYRTTPITDYIKGHHPGDPTPGEYGFVAQFSGLYKGSTYAVSGTITNVGAGANAAIGVNQTAVFDGVSHNVFTSGVIPNVCLANAPAPPPSSPPPSGGGSTGSGSTGSGSSGTTKKSTGANTTGPAPAAAADASVKAGTAAAVVTVPADGAAKIHLAYNQAGAPAVNSDDVAVSNGTASITLSSLLATTPYSFQIVRTGANGTTSTSAAASFTTAGYAIVLHFTDNSKKAVKGIPGSLNDAHSSKATSDSHGDLSFQNLPDGIYTVTFTYQHHTYSSDFDTSTVDASGDPTVLTMHNTLNVDSLHQTQGKVGGGTASVTKHSIWPALIVWFIVLLALGTGGWFFWRRRREQRLSQEYATLASPSVPDVLDKHALEQFAKQPQQPLPAHAGESLRQMVLESMHVQKPPVAAEDPLVSLPPISPAAPSLPLPPTAAPRSMEPPQPVASTHPPVRPAPPPDDDQTLHIPHGR